MQENWAFLRECHGLSYAKHRENADDWFLSQAPSSPWSSVPICRNEPEYWSTYKSLNSENLLVWICSQASLTPKAQGLFTLCCLAWPPGIQKSLRQLLASSPPQLASTSMTSHCLLPECWQLNCKPLSLLTKDCDVCLRNYILTNLNLILVHDPNTYISDRLNRVQTRSVGSASSLCFTTKPQTLQLILKGIIQH